MCVAEVRGDVEDDSHQAVRRSRLLYAREQRIHAAAAAGLRAGAGRLRVELVLAPECWCVYRHLLRRRSHALVGGVITHDLPNLRCRRRGSAVNDPHMRCSLYSGGRQPRMQLHWREAGGWRRVATSCGEDSATAAVMLNAVASDVVAAAPQDASHVRP